LQLYVRQHDNVVRVLDRARSIEFESLTFAVWNYEMMGNEIVEKVIRSTITLQETCIF